MGGAGPGVGAGQGGRGGPWSEGQEAGGRDLEVPSVSLKRTREAALGGPGPGAGGRA